MGIFGVLQVLKILLVENTYTWSPSHHKYDFICGEQGSACRDRGIEAVSDDLNQAVLVYVAVNQETLISGYVNVWPFRLPRRCRSIHLLIVSWHIPLWVSVWYTGARRTKCVIAPEIRVCRLHVHNLPSATKVRKYRINVLTTEPI